MRANRLMRRLHHLRHQVLAHGQKLLHHRHPAIGVRAKVAREMVVLVTA